jgi:hypothetical protein
LKNDKNRNSLIERRAKAKGTEKTEKGIPATNAMSTVD